MGIKLEDLTRAGLVVNADGLVERKRGAINSRFNTHERQVAATNQGAGDPVVQKQQNPWVDIAGKFAGAIPGAVASYATGGMSNVASAASGG